MVAEKEKKTPIFDWEAMDFAVDPRGTIRVATGAKAAEQVAIKAQQTPRSRYLIYADVANARKNHTYGNDAWAILSAPNLSAEARSSEIERAIKEAVAYDPWILDVYDIKVYQVTENGISRDYADLSVRTVFDTTRIEGVGLNG